MFTNNQILGTYDFVDHETSVYEDHSHGTNVLSVIGGKSGDDNLGVAPNANFYLFRTEDVNSEYPIEEINWLLAVEKADSLGVDIVSTSLGYYDFDDAFFNYIYDDTDGKTAYSSLGARIAARTGMLLVNSAGNAGNSTWGYVTFPADADSILTVGAVDEFEEYASFSSYGPTVDGRIKPNVVAQGGSATVLSSSFDIVYSTNGTSFSCPLLAGFAAAVWEAYDTLTNIELLNLIEQAGSNASTPDYLTGYGVPSFTRLQALMGQEDTIISDVPIMTLSPVVDENLLLFVPIELIGQEATVILSTVDGDELYHEKHVLSTASYLTDFSFASLKSGVYILRIGLKSSSNIIRVLKVE